MTALVLQFPHAVETPKQTAGPVMSEDEVVALVGGYRQPARQLRELHARGFERAYRSTRTGRVVLERAHHDAVVRGQFAAPAEPTTGRPSAAPNRAGLRAHFQQKRKK